LKLSHASAYALAALVHMARQPENASVPSHVIAEARSIPWRQLLKALESLVAAGLLRSVRGPNGGYRLARPPKDVTLLEVVETVDGAIRGDAPAVGRGGAAALDRRLQQMCDEAAALARERLAKVTLAELAKGK
jgi:Rrf2 family protein